MSSHKPAFELDLVNANRAILRLRGHWGLDQQVPSFAELMGELQQHQLRQMVCEAEPLQAGVRRIQQEQQGAANRRNPQWYLWCL
ncbi:MAG: hypothetical protein O7F73_01040 [Gammaproteobacteria bacterium]|nr:hypothetical protein [Gammaproteobacteria bacterium]